MEPLVAIDARDGYAPQLRGWGRYARCLVEAFEAAPPPGLRVDAVREGGAGLEVVFEQLRLPMLLRGRGAALIHATNCFLPLVRPCPGVVTINDLAFEAWPSDFARVTGLKYRVLARLAARSAERVICPSAYTRDDVCRRYRVDPDRVCVIPDAPALALGAEEPPEGPYVLAVGDLREKKNLGALVRAFAALKHREGIPHRLMLAGADSGSGPTLKASGLGGSLELTGYVSDDRLDALIRGADLLVHPSLYEGFGLVILEAMVRGTPVLAARATALPETGGDAAAYFDPADPGDLERALSGLLADASARGELARRGLAHAEGFSWERTARETAAVYRELV